MSLQKLNLVSWIFYYEFFLQGWISAVLVVYSLDEHYMISKVGSDLPRLYGYSSILYMLVAFPIGMMLANFVFRFSAKRKLDTFLNDPITASFSRKDSYIRIPLYLLTLVSLCTVLYTFLVMRSIPILQMFMGADSLLLSTMRIEVTKEFAGNVIIRNIFGLMLTPILCYISYAYYRYSCTRKDFLWFLLMVILTVLILTYNLEKAPLVFFLIGFMFLKVYIDGEIRRKTLIIIGSFCFILIVGLYSFLSESFSLQELNNFRAGILGRVLLGQSTGLFMTFDTYPDVYDHIGFKSFSQNFLNLFDLVEEDRSSRVLMERYNATGVELGVGGVMNSFFIAEAFANFGWPGLILSPIYVGFLIQCMYIFFVSSKKTPIVLGIFAYFSYKGGISGGFNEYIYNPVLFIITVVIIGAYFGAGYLKIIKKHY